MKSARMWYREWQDEPGANLLEYFERCQADALEAAAEMVERESQIDREHDVFGISVDIRSMKPDA